jgi:hypothetical protein
MPTKIWVEGEEVIAGDFNQMVQEQVIPTFANAAARDGALPTPTVGMHCFMLDTRQLLQFTDRTTPPSWRRPWSEPWGFMASYAAQDLRFGTSPSYFPGAGYYGLTVPGRAVRVRLSGWSIKDIDGFDAHMIWRGLMGPQPHSVFQDVVATQHQGWAAMMAVEGIILTDATNNQVHFQAWTSAGTASTAWLRVSVHDLGPNPATPIS